MLMRFLGRVCPLVLLCAAISVVTTGPAQADTIPAETSQFITVAAKNATDTTATLTAYQREANGLWTVAAGPMRAFLGSDGMGTPADNVPRTPAGTFGFDQAFGREANPGTAMPYFQATRRDWWDANPTSPTYNSHVVQDKSPGGDSENIYDSGPVYDYAVNIAHNANRTPGKAAGIFLHVTDGKPTLGCIAVDRDQLVKILRWLDPAKKPLISVGLL